jgi:hypothetical protein
MRDGPTLNSQAVTLSGCVTPGVSVGPLPLPASVTLTGKGGRGSVNELTGYFVAGGAGPVIAGSCSSERPCWRAQRH